MEDHEPPTKAGRAVKRVMELEGWTRRDFLRYTNACDERTLRRWLSGTSNPPEHKISRLLIDLGYDPADFDLRPALVPVKGPIGDPESLDELREELRETRAQLNEVTAKLNEAIRLFLDCNPGDQPD